ncbi:hypothetical protein IW261DRAFT_1517954 [Armillaria novae-zelandiae]|uniref:Secreted protein n=1 Tax=Armillaria novae-zelandiae TaxID=153914 RepID=A0AA39NNE9_9AGAR|nr:hypothetical protein IW261DRAFT_1517954 [Armillaria novae-zelandiae]
MPRHHLRYRFTPFLLLLWAPVLLSSSPLCFRAFPSLCRVLTAAAIFDGSRIMALFRDSADIPVLREVWNLLSRHFTVTPPVINESIYPDTELQFSRI